jgi:hypothetical protein
MSMGIPDMTLSEFFWGAGIISLPSGLNASGSDMGYIQTFYALGLVFTFVFYILLFAFFILYLYESNDKFFALFLIVIMFLIEFKEPFIFKYAISFYVLASLLYLQKNRVLK